MPMTSRERILAAIDHRQPDRVPVDLGSTPSSGISAIAYGNLKAHLGLTHGATRVYDVVQQLAQPEDDVLKRFRVDVVDIGRAFNADDSAWQPTVLADGQAAQHPAWFEPERQPDGSFIARMADGLDIARMPAGATFFDQTYFPYVDGYPADFGGLSAEMGRILWAALVHSPWDHADDPGFWDTLRATAIELRNASDRALMPDLIEARYDVINPVQTDCRGMDADGLKTDFGQAICFWGGGCDTRHVLPRGTPREVKDHVKRRLDVFMPGGGFVFSTVHNILPDVPPQNIVAMHEAIEEYNG